MFLFYEKTNVLRAREECVLLVQEECVIPAQKEQVFLDTNTVLSCTQERERFLLPVEHKFVLHKENICVSYNGLNMLLL